MQIHFLRGLGNSSQNKPVFDYMFTLFCFLCATEWYTSVSCALLSYRPMKWPIGYNVIVPGGGLAAGQQRQHHGNVQLCPRHLPERGEEFPAPGAPGVLLHPDPLHPTPPKRLGGHLQGTSHTTGRLLPSPCIKDIAKHNQFRSRLLLSWIISVAERF